MGTLSLNENQKDGPTSSSTASVPTPNPGYLLSELHPNKPSPYAFQTVQQPHSFVAKLPCFTSSASGNLGLEATEPNEHSLKQRNTFVLRKQGLPQQPGAGTVVWLQCRITRNHGSHLHLWPTRPLSLALWPSVTLPPRFLCYWVHRTESLRWHTLPSGVGGGWLALPCDVQVSRQRFGSHA